MELVDAAFGSLSAFGDTLAVLLKLIDVGSVEILSKSSVASSRSVIVVDAVGGREDPKVICYELNRWCRVPCSYLCGSILPC